METKLLEFSWGGNRVELMRETKSICSGFVAMVFAFLVRLYLQIKLPLLMKTEYTGKYRSVVKDF